MSTTDPALRAKIAVLKSHFSMNDNRGGDLARYGLTEAQRAVALFIAGGGSVADYARQNRISPSTVRTHLKAVFAKLGVSRQADLILLLSPI